MLRLEQQQAPWVLSGFYVMTGLWHTICTYWYRHRRRRRSSQVVRPAVDIELGAPCRNPKRVDSGISVSGLTLASKDDTNESRLETRPEEPIHLKLDFGDRIYTKPLEYGTFSRWSAMEELRKDLEGDGIIIEELWDEVEMLRVCSGDWDTRVRPGWELHVHCRDEQAYQEKDRYEDNSDSERTEGEEESWIDDVIDQYQEEWCLPRWRDRVEQEMSTRKYAKEPSWIVLGLGCMSIVFFIVAVVAYTS